MEDTNLELDIVFINEDMEVVKVAKGIPNTRDLHTSDNTAFVLEVNSNSGIKEGDELEFVTDKEVKSSMYVLNENGDVQMELKSGERIFSRPHTKTLIKFAKKSSVTNKDSDYRLLGNRLFKFLDIQFETEPEYVEKN
jgi:hypothetical protein